MDGKGRATDNAFIERWLRSVKHRHIYLDPTENGWDFYQGIEGFVRKYLWWFDDWGVVHHVFIRSLRGNEAFLLPLTLAFAYPLGIFSDNISDELLQPWERKIKNNPSVARNAESIDISIREIVKTSDSEWLGSYFNYSRKKIRVARSAAFSFSLLTCCSLVFILLKWKAIEMPSPFQTGLFVFITGFVIVFCSIWNWKKFTQDFLEKKQTTWAKLNRSESDSQDSD